MIPIEKFRVDRFTSPSTFAPMCVLNITLAEFSSHVSNILTLSYLDDVRVYNKATDAVGFFRLCKTVWHPKARNGMLKLVKLEKGDVTITNLTEEIFIYIS